MNIKKNDKDLKDDNRNVDGEDEMKNDELENTNDKYLKKAHKTNGRSRGRLPKRDRLEREVPQNRELRRPHKMRSSKNEVPKRDRLEGEMSQNRELRRPNKMRYSKNEDGSMRRPRLKTETIASKNFYGKSLPDRKGKKHERL